MHHIIGLSLLVFGMTAGSISGWCQSSFSATAPTSTLSPSMKASSKTAASVNQSKGATTLSPFKLPSDRPLNFVTLEFPPLEYNDENGRATGAAVDIVRELIAQMELKVQITVLPWTRSIEMVKDGRADAIFTTYYVDERANFLDYSKEILIPQIVSLYVKKGSPLGFNGDIRELKDHKIGIVSTISYGEAFDQGRVKYQLKTERVENLELNFRKLLSGRIDYLISNRFTAQYDMERLSLGDAVTELQIPVEVTPSYIGFSKKQSLTGLRDRFDQGLRAMKRSGRYYDILQQHKVRVPRTD